MSDSLTTLADLTHTCPDRYDPVLTNQCPRCTFIQAAAGRGAGRG